MAHRVSEPGAFGDSTVEINRHLLPGDWTTETGSIADWTPQKNVGLVCGTPPCAAFSNLTGHMGESGHGPNASINSCMRDLVHYGGLCEGEDGGRGAEVIAFESVQGAYKKGRELMVDFRDRLSRMTQQEYALHHVLVSGASLGAAQYRRRYYAVFSRIPIGFDEPAQRHVVTVEDATSDLVGAQITVDDQKYPRKAQTDFQRAARRRDGHFDMHINCPTAREGTISRSDLTEGEIQDLRERGWRPNEPLISFLERTQYFPGRFTREHVDARWVSSAPRLVDAKQPGQVITGGAGRAFVHWSENRYLTAREGSRLMGYPDEWRWATESPLQAWTLIGKNCPVQSARWVSERVGLALDGEPETIGAVLSEREYVYDHTNAYKSWFLEPDNATPTRAPRRKHGARRWLADWLPYRA